MYKYTKRRCWAVHLTYHVRPVLSVVSCRWPAVVGEVSPSRGSPAFPYRMTRHCCTTVKGRKAFCISAFLHASHARCTHFTANNLIQILSRTVCFQLSLFCGLEMKTIHYHHYCRMRLTITLQLPQIVDLTHRYKNWLQIIDWKVMVKVVVLS